MTYGYQAPSTIYIATYMRACAYNNYCQLKTAWVYNWDRCSIHSQAMEEQLQQQQISLASRELATTRSFKNENVLPNTRNPHWVIFKIIIVIQ